MSRIELRRSRYEEHCISRILGQVVDLGGSQGCVGGSRTPTEGLICPYLIICCKTLDTLMKEREKVKAQRQPSTHVSKLVCFVYSVTCFH